MSYRENYRNMASAFRRQNTRKADPISSEDADRIETYIPQIGRSLHKSLEELLSIKERFSENTINFMDDRASQEQYRRFRGTSEAVDDLDQALQRALKTSMTCWQSFQDFKDWLFLFFRTYTVDETMHVAEWGDESYRHLMRILENLAAAVQEGEEDFQPTVHRIVYR